MRRLLTAALIATTATLALVPATAQSPADQRRWQDAQTRYRAEQQRYRAERDRYLRLGGRDVYQTDRDDDYGQDGPDGPPYGYGQPGRPGYAQPGYAQPSYQQPGYQQPYGQPGAGDYARAPYPADDRYENGYDAARDYRQGNYQERVLSTNDRVYAGNDGRYYCKRTDGTTGLIVGGAAGGVLGNVIDGGHSRTVGTLLGGAVGALLGKTVEQQNTQVRCR